MRGLWTCPKCGRNLRVPNQEHVCEIYRLEPHFEKRDPLGQIAFEWICDILDPLGPYQILPMKTTIGFAQQGNIAFLTTKRRGAELSFILAPGLSEPRFCGVTPYSKSKAIYRVRIAGETELDDEASEWLRQAYALNMELGLS